MEALPLVTVYIQGPLPNLLPPAGAIGATPGNCHEQSSFFT